MRFRFAGVGQPTFAAQIPVLRTAVVYTGAEQVVFVRSCASRPAVKEESFCVCRCPGGGLHHQNAVALCLDGIVRVDGYDFDLRGAGGAGSRAAHFQDIGTLIICRATEPGIEHQHAIVSCIIAPDGQPVRCRSVGEVDRAGVADIYKRRRTEGFDGKRSAPGKNRARGIDDKVASPCSAVAQCEHVGRLGKGERRILGQFKQFPADIARGLVANGVSPQQIVVLEPAVNDEVPLEMFAGQTDKCCSIRLCACINSVDEASAPENRIWIGDLTRGGRQ